MVGNAFFLSVSVSVATMKDCGALTLSMTGISTGGAPKKTEKANLFPE
jgi:hypothetical protein